MSKLTDKFKNTDTSEKHKRFDEEEERRPTATNNQIKKMDDNWEDDDDFPDLGKKPDGKNTGAKTKKTVSKSNQPAAWGEAQNDILAEEFKKKDVPQKGIMRLPGKNHAFKAEDFEEGEFPEIGAEIDPTKIKKKTKPQEPTPIASDMNSKTQSGPKKFTNTKKTVGETFSQIETPAENKETIPEETEQPSKTQKTEESTIVKSRPEGEKQDFGKQDSGKQDSGKKDNGGFSFQRGPNRSEIASKAETAKDEEKTEAVAADSKFKFGGDGPKRFVSLKKEGSGPTIRENQKTEADIKREEAERRAEEALQLEREKIAAETQMRKNKSGPKNEKSGEKPREDKPIQKAENGKTHDNVHKEKNEHHHNTDGKRSEKQGDKKPKNEDFFSKDQAKGGDKIKKEAQPEKEQAAQEELPKVTVTQVIKNDLSGGLSQTGWGAPIAKSKK